MTLTPFKPGFWLACLAVFGAFSAFAFPRILAGATDIVPLGGGVLFPTNPTVPLAPVASNLTQSIYMIANVFCFALIAAVAGDRKGFNAIAVALIAYAAANVFFGLLDLATYATGTQGWLDFMRNTRYTMHHEEEVRGLKRIVGSFTETSAFAHSALGAFAFTGTLWLCGRSPLVTGTLALASFVLLVLSTSSAGLAGAPIVLLLLYATAVWISVFQSRRHSAIVTLTAPLVAVTAILLVFANDEAAAAIGQYIDVVVLDKFTTSSGVERMSWNSVALQNFMDTWGLGVGLGTVRTSSLLVALLSNVGVLGLILYALFVYTALAPRPAPEKTTSLFLSDARMAARNACFSLILVDLLVGSTVDQGLIFYIFAALAAAYPSDDVRTYSPRTPA